MKFNIEINIDWIDEDHTLDSLVQEKIEKALVDKIYKDFSSDVGNRIASTAENYIKAKTELVINTALENPITITEGWNNTKTYDSVFAMVEERMTKLYQGKLGDGNKCEKDPLLSNIQNFVDQKVKTLLYDVEKLARKMANESAINAVNDSELIKAIGIVMRDKKKK